MMNTRLLLSMAITLICLTFSTTSLAWLEKGGERDEALKLKPDLENGVDVYEVCAACHLTEGWGTKEGTFPQLAGQLKGVLIKQLADIREGNRDNPTMYPFALPEESMYRSKKHKKMSSSGYFFTSHSLSLSPLSWNVSSLTLQTFTNKLSVFQPFLWRLLL